MLNLLIVAFCLLARTSLAAIEVKDTITPFIEGYTLLKDKTPSGIKKYIESYELSLSREMKKTYYQQTSAEEAKRYAENLNELVKHLPELVPIYRNQLAEIKKILLELQRRYLKEFSIDLNAPVYLWIALADTDGRGTFIDHKRGFSLNFRVIKNYDRNSLEILLAHELFHVIQNEIFGFQRVTETVGRGIILEGWASFASSVIYPGQPDWKYISYWKKDSALFDEYQKNKTALALAAADDWESSKATDFEAYFSGAGGGARKWPPRSGYFIGFLLAKKLSKTVDPKHLLKKPYEELATLCKRLLKENPPLF